MKEAYPYLICLLAGVIIGMVLMWFLVKNEINNVTLGKVKQKGDGTMDTTTIIEAAKKVDKKLQRIERRKARKGVINN